MPAFNLTISEQTGLGRAVVLRGRSLPFQGVAFGMQQRVEINWFPGNPVGTAQVNGPTHMPTTMGGRWSDIFLFDDAHAATLLGFPALQTQVSVADFTGFAGGEATFKSGGVTPSQYARTAGALRDTFYKICKSGQLLRVEWGKIVRFGFLLEFTPTHDREEDIDWEMQFAWVGSSKNQPKPATKSKDMTSLLKQLIATVQNALNELNGAIFQIEVIKRRVSQSIIRLGSLAEELFGALERISVLTLTPLELLGTVKATLKGIQLAANDLLATFEAISAAVATSSTGDPAQVSVNSGAQQAARKLLLQLAAEGRLGQIEIERFESPSIRAVVQAQQGQTLRDISIAEYNTPNNWRAIQDFNGFEGSVVAPGTLVRVPEL